MFSNPSKYNYIPRFQLVSNPLTQMGRLYVLLNIIERQRCFIITIIRPVILFLFVNTATSPLVWYKTDCALFATILRTCMLYIYTRTEACTILLLLCPQSC